MAELDNLFKQIPLLDRYRVTDFKQIELPSLTNRNIRLINDELDLILRLPNPAVTGEVDRNTEFHNHSIALEQGIALDILWRNQDGVQLSAWFPGCREVVAEDLSDHAFLVNLVSRIADLHQSKPAFDGVVSIDERLTYFHEQVEAPIEDAQIDTLNDLLDRYQSLKQYETKTVNSHNDLNLGNCLKAGDGSVWLIDWEYSAQASPYWDLATLSNQMDWSKEQKEELLEIYCGLCPLTGKMDLNLLQCYQDMLVQLEQLWLKLHDRAIS